PGCHGNYLPPLLLYCRHRSCLGVRCPQVPQPYTPCGAVERLWAGAFLPFFLCSEQLGVSRSRRYPTSAARKGWARLKPSWLDILLLPPPAALKHESDERSI